MEHEFCQDSGSPAGLSYLNKEPELLYFMRVKVVNPTIMQIECINSDEYKICWVALKWPRVSSSLANDQMVFRRRKIAFSESLTLRRGRNNKRIIIGYDTLWQLFVWQTWTRHLLDLSWMIAMFYSRTTKTTWLFSVENPEEREELEYISVSIYPRLAFNMY